MFKYCENLHKITNRNFIQKNLFNHKFRNDQKRHISKLLEKEHKKI